MAYIIICFCIIFCFFYRDLTGMEQSRAHNDTAHKVPCLKFWAARQVVLSREQIPENTLPKDLVLYVKFAQDLARENKNLNPAFFCKKYVYKGKSKQNKPISPRNVYLEEFSPCGGGQLPNLIKPI